MLRVCECVTNRNTMCCLHLFKVDSEGRDGRLQYVYFTFPSKFPVLGQAEHPTMTQSKETSRWQRVLNTTMSVGTASK